MAKKGKTEPSALDPLQLQELERQRQTEAEKARVMEELREMELAEQSVMDCLVESDTDARALAELAEKGLGVKVWSLRYMIVERLGRQILLGEGYTQAELQQWLAPYALKDEKSYVRRAAIKHLTDIAALAASSAGDAESIVRKKAVQQLFKFLDQADALKALDAVSVNDPVPELRHMAVLRIVDQDVITKVAKEDVVPEIRQSAVKKLTSQATLAWITINDATQMVRSTAAELMTDVTALVQAAAAQEAANAQEAPREEPAEEAAEA